MWWNPLQLFLRRGWKDGRMLRVRYRKKNMTISISKTKICSYWGDNCLCSHCRHCVRVFGDKHKRSRDVFVLHVTGVTWQVWRENWKHEQQESVNTWRGGRKRKRKRKERHLISRLHLGSKRKDWQFPNTDNDTSCDPQPYVVVSVPSICQMFLKICICRGSDWAQSWRRERAQLTDAVSLSDCFSSLDSFCSSSSFTLMKKKRKNQLASS